MEPATKRTTEWSKYQHDIFSEFEEGTGNVVVQARAGTGKCLGLGTPVLMFDGSIKPVERVEVGDELMGPDSTPRRVLSTTRGYGPMWVVGPIKGEPWRCNDVHVLTLVGTNRMAGEVIDVSLREHLANCERAGKQPDRDWKLFRVGVQWPESEQLIDPYVVGVWIGDGSRGTPQVTNCEPEIESALRSEAERLGLELVVRDVPRNRTKNLRMRVGPRGEAGGHTPHVFARFVRERCESRGEKTIPREYLIASTEQRMALLAGLLDTDGHLREGCFYIASSVRGLAEQYAFLARSLGFAATIRHKRTTCQGGFVGEAWQVTLSGHLDRIPTRIERRRASKRKQIKDHLRTGFVLIPDGDGEYAGFELDGDGRFLLGDFTVTHNTTTIIEASEYIPRGRRTMLVAFNKSIQRELAERAPRGVEVKTLHGAGFAVLGRAFGNLTVDENKSRTIAEGVLVSLGIVARNARGKIEPIGVGRVAKLVGLAKANLLSDRVALLDLCIEHNIEEDHRFPLVRVVEVALATMEKCKDDTETIDYDDMIWLPVVHGLRPQTHDVVIVDEAQDMNAAQIELVRSIVRPKGRIIAVGDDRQAIYGWAGAGKDSLFRLVESVDAKVLPLTITYRCPRSVVRLVNHIVPDYEAAPNAPEGTIRSVQFNSPQFDPSPGDFVISRSNAPLVRVALALLARGRPATIAGRDIAKHLVRVLERSKRDDVVEMLRWLRAHTQKETEKFLAAEKPKKAEEARDIEQAILALCEGEQSVSAVVGKTQRLFSDGDQRARIVCTSTHKAKGLERDRVWMLVETYSDRTEEEKNLYYVAATRAKSELVMVHGVVNQ